MKNHVRVRIGSALLSLTMALSLLPASVLAAEIPSVHTEEDVSTSVPVEETQSKVTITGKEGSYATLSEAIHAAAPGDTLVLGGDLEVDAKILINKQITLDGSGYTVKATGTWSTSNLSKQLLGVEGSAAAGTVIQNITLDSNSKAYGFQPYDVNGTVILSNVTLQNSAGTGMSVNGSSVIADQLTITGSGWSQSIDVSNGVGIEGSPMLILTNSDLQDPIGIFEDIPASGVQGNSAAVKVDGVVYQAVEHKIGEKYKLIYQGMPVKIGEQGYQTLEEAVEAAAPSDTIELFDNIALTSCLELDKSLTIQGNHHTITNTANRIIRLTQPDLDVKIYNCDLISKCTASSDVRGISFDSVASNASLLLDGCSISASFYAINIIPGPSNISITIRNGSVAAGWAAINSYSNNSTFVIENSQLTGLNDKGESQWNNFATIVFDGFGFSTHDNIGKYGSNNTVRILNSTVMASTESSNSQDWLSLQYGATGNQVYVDSASRIVDDAANDMSEAIYISYRTGTSSNPGQTYNPDHLISVQKSAEAYRIWAPAGNTIPLPDAPSKNGYSFDGWSDGTGVYPAASSYTMPESSTITLTAQWSAISSGGSSSGGSSSGDKTETVTNPDGSTTTTVTKPDGTVTETTKNPDGSKEVVETKKDGTTTTTTTDKSGNKTETVENPDGSSKTTVDNKDGSSSTTTVSEDGKVEAEVKLPAAVVNDAADKGETVALPMPQVPVTTSKENAPTVTVTLPSNTSAKVEIPVAEVTPGTVAVIVKADGTEEIIKTTLTTDNGVAVTLSDGDTVKIVDNSKEFDDVSSLHWGSDYIDFATSRELFSGTSATTFSPETVMTRAMIVTVLASYDGADTSASAGEAWYTSGQQWAVENGISDGSNMENSLNREQLAVMLWNYAGKPAPSGNLSSFSDAYDTSDWAAQAMAWAVENGLISGMGDGSLDPQGLATRAQVATIMSQFVALTA